MWRRAYLLLALVRLYFALSPSYLHPDENFQGPEVIAGQIFSYPVKLTWEFTSENPIRSVFPLWPVYGLPMLLLKWIWIGNGQGGEVTPAVVFWTLRVLMFLLSFVLEDWAIHELVGKPRHRSLVILLVASSYVTWTFQAHTFSNSLETILVAWSLVLIQRIVDDKQRTSPFASALLAFLAVFGFFNRITFPAFLFIPAFRLIPHFARKPLSLLFMVISGLWTLFFAIAIDTEFYTPHPVTWSTLFTHPIITPLNNLRYNLATSNLALHGLHPRYTHLLINLPQLLGPAFLLLFFRPHASLRLYSAISGILVLSVLQHQEARFLIPTIPLILSSIRLPARKSHLRIFAAAWLGFNIVFGVLMGSYHQGGVVPTQFHLANLEDATHALWWKTYSPPVWLLNGKNEVLTTHDLMGMPGDEMVERLRALATCSPPSSSSSNKSDKEKTGTYLVAPLSARYLEEYIEGSNGTRGGLRFEEVWRYRMHLNLDDLDFGDDGVWPTLKRVVGRRGLATWRVSRDCSSSSGWRS
ncbi:hypothetical protein VE03_09022 [Pseudogymnoascus sp. 23342-1-I1]|nr:hypothetical protein VE03_09022 [Pseudogymnoascus sp. 23342-1-I1]